MPNCPAAFLLALVAPLAGQRVWVVAPSMGSGVHFTQIQPAVDAAADGDMVLVRAGTYVTFLVDGKALAVVADGTNVVLTPDGLSGVRVANLAAGQAVVVRGFTQASALLGLSVSNCQGPVHVEDCQATAIAGSFIGAGCQVYASPQVSLVRCSFSCLPSTPRTGGPGLSVSTSTVFLHECSATGASSTTLGWTGYDGAVLLNSFVHVAGCTIRGGQGGFGTNFGTCSPPGDGGDAVELSDAASSISVLDCQLVPGQPGTPGLGCPPGQPGQVIRGPGSRTVRTGNTVLLSASSPVRMGQQLAVSCRGPAGAPAWLAVSPRQAPTFVDPCNGALHVDLTVGAVLFVGFLSATGQLTLALPVPLLPYAGAVMYLQLGATPPAGCFLGSPSVALLLDPRY